MCATVQKEFGSRQEGPGVFGVRANGGLRRALMLPSTDRNMLGCFHHTSTTYTFPFFFHAVGLVHQSSISNIILKQGLLVHRLEKKKKQKTHENMQVIALNKVIHPRGKTLKLIGTSKFTGSFLA